MKEEESVPELCAQLDKISEWLSHVKVKEGNKINLAQENNLCK